MRHQSFFQFEQRFSQSSVLARVARCRSELLGMSEQGFAAVCIEIKKNHVESGDLEEGLALAGEPVTELFEFSLHEFVSRFSESELQWGDSTESSFRLVQPGIGFVFVAKDLLS
jgi:hypothetical protein